MTISLKIAVAVCAIVLAPSASAQVYNWTITSSLYNGSGQLTTDDTPVATNVFLVTAFEGALNGWDVSLRAPDTYGNNNLLDLDGVAFPDVGQTSSLVGHQGIAFTADGLSWRLYAQLTGSHPTVLESICCFSLVSFSVEPAVAPAVPEPATWAMMLFGFGAVGFAMRHRKQVKLSSQRTA